MNAKSSIPDWQHQDNRRVCELLTAKGYRFEITSQGYQVWFNDDYLGGAGALKKPHGANLRDNLSSALITARHHLNAPVTA